LTHAFVAVVVPFGAARSDEVNQVLDGLGNPVTGDCAQALDASASVHFMSMVVVPARDEENIAHLVIHVCADGHARAALADLAEAIAGPLLDVLNATGIAVPAREQLGTYLEAHRVEVDLGWLAAFGWFATTGLAFVGTPGMTVRRIKDEAALAERIRQLLEGDTAPDSALEKLERVRRSIFADAAFKWAFLSEPVPLLGEAKPATDSVWPLVKAAFRDFLSPLIWPPVLVFMWSRFVGRNALDNALWHMALGLMIELLIAAIVVLIGYGILRRQEEADEPFDVEPSQDRMRRILKRENRPGVLQNHLAGVSILKAGLVRRVTLRLALWLIGESGTRRSRPGFIDKIGSIHFAQWLRLPGTNRLVFLSNYDGSWQSYLEDFIARLREGLTSVWSNTLDFPKTTNLVAGGAGDGARFKRWARRQQRPTRFWYTAYPHLTNSHIRTHAAVRHGFASASTGSEAAKWLALFGYAQPESVETEEIPTLVFGGLPRLRFARCLVFGLGKARDASWLRDIERQISYGARLPDGTALAVAFTRGGMTRLGLDDNALATFPTAFQQGMAAPERALGDGDTGTWRWGKLLEGSDETDVDAILMIYADTADNLEKEAARIKEKLASAKYVPLEEIQLSEVAEKNTVTDQRDVREAFGFRDGISQPVMRGSRDWSKPENAIHAVEPGELVLGYRDNLGKLGPSPHSYGQDIGRNGTFLVVRQLGQDVEGFTQYLEKAATQYKNDPRVPADHRLAPAEWIAAKMVGRWKDGSSLVLNPDPAKNPTPDNEFMFGRDDPDGLRCPLGAHIRRANPRDSFDPGSAVQVAIANRHRILRVGRSYGPQNGLKAGLLFMCINADIERQFEFLQQSWLLGSNFHGLNNEIDPVVGFRNEDDTMTVPTPRGPLRLQGLAKFVSVLGGGYFFMPGRSAMRMLIERAAPPKPGTIATAAEHGVS